MKDNHNLTQLLLKTLCEKYPKCFNLKDRKPLKIGIDEDILQENSNINTENLKKAIGYYCGNIHYHGSFAESTHRIDLNGKPCQIIDAPHKDNASHAYNRLKKKFSAKKTNRSQNTYKNSSRPISKKHEVSAHE